LNGPHAIDYPASAHVPTAVDVQLLAGDETALVRQQIGHGVGYVGYIGSERKRLPFDHDSTLVVAANPGNWER
jgi:hypothetical protein